jgi:hypothetical protein
MALQMFIHPEDGRVHSEVQFPIDFALINSQRDGAGERLRALVGTSAIPFDRTIEERIVRRYAFQKDVRCTILDWVLCLLTIGLCSITECQDVPLKMEKEIQVAQPVVVRKLLDSGLEPSNFTIVDCEQSNSSDPALYFLTVYFNIQLDDDLIKKAQIEEYQRQEQQHYATGVGLATGSYDVVGLNRFEFDRVAKVRQKWMALEESEGTKNRMNKKKFQRIVEGIHDNHAKHKCLALNGDFFGPKIGDEGAILLAEVL